MPKTAPLRPCWRPGCPVADICGEAGVGSRHADPLCQACQIAGGADLPQLSGAVHPAALVLLAEITRPAKRKDAAGPGPARTPQGPPVG
jgi:hypothetical protein